MEYLKKFYFFDPAKTGVKRELLLASCAVDFITWYKKGGEVSEGTMLHTNLNRGQDFIRHVIEGVPENCNQIAFDGLLFKITVQYPAESGGIKKYTAWINPDNVVSMYSLLPGTTEIFFRSGYSIIGENNCSQIFKSLIDHNKKYRERQKIKYGNSK